jgi:hypothetical protein
VLYVFVCQYVCQYACKWFTYLCVSMCVSVDVSALRICVSVCMSDINEAFVILADNLRRTLLNIDDGFLTSETPLT